MLVVVIIMIILNDDEDYDSHTKCDNYDIDGSNNNNNISNNTDESTLSDQIQGMYLKHHRIACSRLSQGCSRCTPNLLSLFILDQNSEGQIRVGSL